MQREKTDENENKSVTHSADPALEVDGQLGRPSRLGEDRIGRTETGVGHLSLRQQQSFTALLPHHGDPEIQDKSADLQLG